MFIEIAAFAGLCGVFYAAGAGRSWLERRRARSRRRAWERVCGQLRQQTVADAIARLGPPTERLEGTTGRVLMIWKLPAGNSLAVITGTVDQGRVTEMSLRFY